MARYRPDNNADRVHMPCRYRCKKIGLKRLYLCVFLGRDFLQILSLIDGLRDHLKVQVDSEINYEQRKNYAMGCTRLSRLSIRSTIGFADIYRRNISLTVLKITQQLRIRTYILRAARMNTHAKRMSSQLTQRQHETLLWFYIVPEYLRRLER
jgi:hypothetical protein